MRTYRIASYTGTAGLELTQEPDPAPPVARQVLVRLRAASINYREWLDLHGGIAQFAALPDRRIPGSDGAGEVLAVGPEVTRVKPGDRVALTFYAQWIGGEMPACMSSIGRSALPNDGTLAELTCVDESELVHLPANLSFEEAATLPCAGVTAWTSLFGTIPLLPGQSVLIQGSGGVAIAALQWARLAGLRVLVTTTQPAKADALRALGAHAVIDASAGQDWAAGVLAATDGQGVDRSLNTSGGSSLAGCSLATRVGGQLVLIGFRDGALGELGPSVMMRGQTVQVTRVGSREHFEQMLRAIAASGVKPVVAQVFDFEQARAAFECFAQAQHIGKIVIRHGAA